MGKLRKTPWPVLAGAVFVFAFCGLFARRQLGGVPHVIDEAAYLFQAKIFALGRTSVPSPCEPEAFDYPHVINNGKWYSQYPPGFPLLLVPGVLLGAPWLISPLLAGLSILLFYRFGETLYGRRVGLWSAVLGAFSIWHLLMSSTMMAHTAGMVGAAAFLLFGARWARAPSFTNAVLAGLGWGMGFLIRPYSMIALSLPFLVFAGVRCLKNVRKVYQSALAFGFAVLAAASLLMLYNLLTNGHPLLMGYIVRYGPDHTIGFGRSGYWGMPHTPMLGAANSLDQLRSLNSYLFGWPVSSLLGLAALGISWASGRRRRGTDLLLLCGPVALLAAYFFWAAGWSFIGPRHLYESLPILLTLTACGLLEIPRMASRLVPRWRARRIRRVVAMVLAGFISYALFLRFPDWVRPKDDAWFHNNYGREFDGLSPAIHAAVKRLPLGKSVVILRFLYHPVPSLPGAWFGSGFIFNDPLLKGEIIYAADRGKRNDELVRCFPGRHFYLYVGTLSRGMLFPLGVKAGGLETGETLDIPAGRAGPIEWLTDPREFFVPYSPEFEDFLDRQVGIRGLDRLDVRSLYAEANELKLGRDFREAARFYEAALQIENDPRIRNELYFGLAACYQKLGLKGAELRIMAFLNSRDSRHSRKLFIDKGF